MTIHRVVTFFGREVKNEVVPPGGDWHRVLSKRHFTDPSRAIYIESPDEIEIDGSQPKYINGRAVASHSYTGFLKKEEINSARIEKRGLFPFTKIIYRWTPK